MVPQLASSEFPQLKLTPTQLAGQGTGGGIYFDEEKSSLAWLIEVHGSVKISLQKELFTSSYCVTQLTFQFYLYLLQCNRNCFLLFLVF